MRWMVTLLLLTPFVLWGCADTGGTMVALDDDDGGEDDDAGDDDAGDDDAGDDDAGDDDAGDDDAGDDCPLQCDTYGGWSGIRMTMPDGQMMEMECPAFVSCCASAQRSSSSSSTMRM